MSLLLGASALRFLAGFTIGVWIVPFYREAFPGSIGTEFALIKAAVNGVAGSVSATAGGVLADSLATRDARFQQSPSPSPSPERSQQSVAAAAPSTFRTPRANSSATLSTPGSPTHDRWVPAGPSPYP